MATSTYSTRLHQFWSFSELIQRRQSFCEAFLLSHSVKAFCEIILYVGSFDGFLGQAMLWDGDFSVTPKHHDE
jgi:hypothetical protein